jgi:hypothetical protein
MDDYLFVADQDGRVGALVLLLAVDAVDGGLGVVLTKSKVDSAKGKLKSLVWLESWCGEFRLTAFDVPLCPLNSEPLSKRTVD